MAATKNILKHGGQRAGAGRKPGQGPYGEPTTLLRVPNSQLSSVTKFLSEYRQRIEVSREVTKRLIGQMMLPLGEPPEQRIPLYGTKIRAGFPSPADDHVEAELDLNEFLIKNPPATFMLSVEGDSMIGAGIFEGDTIVVDRSLNPKHGSVVVAAVDGQLTVKRLYKRYGKVRLDAENSNYPPIELQDGQELIIFGVVTSCIHPVK